MRTAARPAAPSVVYTHVVTADQRQTKIPRRRRRNRRRSCRRCRRERRSGRRSRHLHTPAVRRPRAARRSAVRAAALTADTVPARRLVPEIDRRRRGPLGSAGSPVDAVPAARALKLETVPMQTAAPPAAQPVPDTHVVAAHHRNPQAERRRRRAERKTRIILALVLRALRLRRLRSLARRILRPNTALAFVRRSEHQQHREQETGDDRQRESDRCPVSTPRR